MPVPERVVFRDSDGCPRWFKPADAIKQWPADWEGSCIGGGDEPAFDVEDWAVLYLLKSGRWVLCEWRVIHTNPEQWQYSDVRQLSDAEAVAWLLERNLDVPGTAAATLAQMDLSAAESAQPTKPKGTRRRRPATRTESIPTEKQTEAMNLYEIHGGNISAVADALGITSNSARDRLRAAHKKLGIAMADAAQRVKTLPYRSDRRGTVDLAQEDDRRREGGD